MKNRRLFSLVGLAVTAVLITAYLMARSGRANYTPISEPAAAQVRDEKAMYYCPMHTHYKADKPGNCPICSMKLVKLEQPAATGEAVPPTQAMPGMQMGAEPAATGAAAGPGTIFVAPQRQQLIGVQSVPVVWKRLDKEIRAVGKVAFDERKLTHIHTKVTGYIEEVFVDFVGKGVKRGDPLFTIYSPEMVSTQQEYLIARRGQIYLKDSPYTEVVSGANSLVGAARERLRLWDVSETEIETLEKEGKVKRALTIHSPVDGVVTERMAYHHGRYVNPEMDLYTIVDLSTVWVQAEIYEYELAEVKEGQWAEVEFPYASGTKTLPGKVSFVYPYLNAKTRTTQVRMEFANPDQTLRPDMFLNVKLRISLGDQLVVPEDAVLDTGTQQYVFVDRGQGYFEPRAVKVETEAGGYYAIRSGLKVGERVVTAANFILDSESRLKGAFANMGKPTMPEAGAPAAMGQKLSVEILEPKQAKVGKNTIRLTVRDAAGNPVEGAEVEVALSMPQMGSMPPMSSKAVLQHQGKGQYTGTIEIPMAWTWQATVTAKKGGTELGTVQTNITAR